MSRPNFLFIMTDTQATNMVGCYSGQPLNTNHIDKLAEEGIRFNSAYTCSPVCTPARAGLFTGIYANQSGPWTNNVARGKTSPPWALFSGRGLSHLLHRQMAPRRARLLRHRRLPAGVGCGVLV
jgi:Arylsulfatase A and related enzymes